MHQVIKVLSKISDRYAPSRMLSFNMAHIYKTMQLIRVQTRVSRETLITELGLGEGSIKTLIKHLKMNGLVNTSKGGTRLTEKGRTLLSKIDTIIPHESLIPKCSVGFGKFNYAILLKGISTGIGSGIEQRDFAKMMGGAGATTLLYENERFLMPGRTQDSLKNERKIRELIMESLFPQNDDVIIMSSANDRRTAELAAKYAALMTVADHHKHF